MPQPYYSTPQPAATPNPFVEFSLRRLSNEVDPDASVCRTELKTAA
ncbi:hypothetical protein PENARI_c003G01909 [Penicillium arizonense]|uniref:Uncharacterized protein n=1 Tax=Penicillium arizonense TaxID=1835702 RepID=A0A1F5LTN0_PENAI|nr:hypothetical protein PENARI_c003G01909 [Penicillium arizonense]OGE56497.1 hypothetical protein PENARI_c003G01909 [Penicillium arizonense]